MLRSAPKCQFSRAHSHIHVGRKACKQGIRGVMWYGPSKLYMYFDQTVYFLKSFNQCFHRSKFFCYLKFFCKAKEISYSQEKKFSLFITPHLSQCHVCIVMPSKWNKYPLIELSQESGKWWRLICANLTFPKINVCIVFHTCVTSKRIHPNL